MEKLLDSKVYKWINASIGLLLMICLFTPTISIKADGDATYSFFNIVDFVTYHGHYLSYSVVIVICSALIVCLSLLYLGYSIIKQDPKYLKIMNISMGALILCILITCCIIQVYILLGLSLFLFILSLFAIFATFIKGDNDGE